MPRNTAAIARTACGRAALRRCRSACCRRACSATTEAPATPAGGAACATGAAAGVISAQPMHVTARAALSQRARSPAATEPPHTAQRPGWRTVMSRTAMAGTVRGDRPRGGRPVMRPVGEHAVPGHTGRVEAVLSSDARWEAQTGPALSEAGAARLLSLSPTDLRRRPGLLRLRNRDGSVVYPVFQFDGNAQLPGVTDVVAAFTPVVTTPLTTASWLTGPNRTLDGSRPLDVLRGRGRHPRRRPGHADRGQHERLTGTATGQRLRRQPGRTATAQAIAARARASASRTVRASLTTCSGTSR